MTDFASARANMVESQVRPSDVTNIEISSAMGHLPREKFVPKGRVPLAYMDLQVECGDGRSMMSPRVLAKLIQAADVKSGDLVLCLGCGTGYSAAVLGRLADSVIALECDEQLATKAERVLSELELDNIAVVTSSLAAGYASQGPYDVIFVDGAVPGISDTLKAQLTDGGRLVAVLRTGTFGKAMLMEKVGDEVFERELFDADAPDLPEFDREVPFRL